MDNILNEIEKIVGKEYILKNEPMKNHTSFKIGGPAIAVVKPNSIEKLIEIIKLLKKENIKHYILGNGTNVLFPDEGYNGIIIKIAEQFNEITINGNEVYVKAGELLSKVSKIAAKESLTGLEFALGIPGTIGGAVIMNAGAYDGEMKDVVKSVEVINQQGELIVLKNDEMLFGYRSSIAKEKDYIILGVKLELEKGNSDDIYNKMDELTKKRTSKQPLHLPSAGSTFKRPKGNYAGKLIEDAGLKGLTYGGAQVSDLHSGFIVNINNASYDDVVTLIDMVKSIVKEKFEIDLELEIKIIERN